MPIKPYAASLSATLRRLLRRRDRVRLRSPAQAQRLRALTEGVQELMGSARDGRERDLVRASLQALQALQRSLDGPCAAEESNARGAGPGALVAARVLVLADEELSSELEGMLRGWGAHPHRVSNSVRAFSELADAGETDGAPPVVLAQQERLDMPADQFVAALRADPVLKRISLILVAEREDAQSEQRARDAGYSAVLVRPVDKRMLFGALHAARSELRAARKVVSLNERYKGQRLQRRLRVLVAEDNRISRTVIQHVLESAGISVDIARDGEEALDVLAAGERAYDLMILDMNMPGLGGLEVARTVRFMGSGSGVPVIVLTSNATAEAAQACAKAGIDAFMAKPVEASALLGTIERLTRADKQAEPGARGPRPTIDEIALNNLSQLGVGPGFVRELVEGFVADGERAVQAIGASHARRDYRRFRDAVQALKGTAGDMGAVLLVDLCIEAERIRSYELDLHRTQLLADEIASAFSATCSALTEFVDKQRDAIT